jgi:hypothetical protein
MHGIIHLELQKFVIDRYGEPAWQDLCMHRGDPSCVIKFQQNA